MKNKTNSTLLFLVIFFFALLNSFLVVKQSEQVIIVQFGKPIRVIRDAGLYFKIPLVQTNISFDNRLLDLVVNDKEVIALDQKRLIVNSFAKFRIREPISFYNAFRENMNDSNVSAQLNNMLESSLREVVGSFVFTDLLSTKRSQIMQDIEDKLNTRVKQYGIEIIDTRIMRADLPSANSNAIFKRMQTERELEAKQIRAEGDESAKKIIANADKERTIMLAEANKKSKILRGEGDAKAAEIFNNTFSADPSFYEFYKSMQIYKKTMSNNNSRIIITPNNELYKLLGF